MKTIRNKTVLLAAAGLLSASMSIAQAQPYYLTGSYPAFNPSWSPGVAAYEMTGGPTVYSLSLATADESGDPYFEWKVIAGTDWSAPNYPANGNNARMQPDATGSNTFYFYPGVSADGWTPVNNRLGCADPGGLTFEVAGDFNGWNGGAGYQLNPIGNGVYSNSIVIATAGTYGYKIRTVGTWNDIAFGSDFGYGSDNLSLTTSNSPQTVPIQFDLPGGRWIVGLAPVPPVTNYVVFAVDLTNEIFYGHFVPGADTAYVSGDWAGWPTPTSGSGLVLVNDPPLYGDTNIYYGTNEFIGTPGSAVAQYKFTSDDPYWVDQPTSTGYEPGANRVVTLATTSGVILPPIPVATWGSLSFSDYVPADTVVTFTVNMTNATTSTNSPSALNSPQPYTAHTFDPGADSVYINGSFLSGGWTGWDPISISANQLDNNPPESELYQFTFTVPRGSMALIQYQYCLGYGDNPSTNNIMEDEGASSHERYIRETETGSYSLPTDTFGNQYVEPEFGELAVAPAANGKVSVSWLGGIGVRVQTSATVAGPWVEHAETDGTNWITGSTSTDGFLSSTNWPVTGSSQFFRLVRRQ
jgi:hypothetical protein